MAPVTHEPSPADPMRHFSGRAMAGSLLLTAIFDIGVAILVFDLAKARGVSDQIAYLLSGIGPLIMIAITWVRARALSGASLIILVFLVLSSLAAFIGGTDSRLLIVKDSVVTAGFGLACLASLLLPRPLMFYFGAKFGTDGTREGIAHWNHLWRYPEFRKVQYRINNVWGIAYLVEAALRIGIVYSIPSFSVAYTITTVLPFVILAGLIYWTIATGTRARKQGAERAAARIKAEQENAGEPSTGATAARATPAGSPPSP
jgi:hypothetical protein